MASSAVYVEGPRHAAITTANVGPVISIITLLFMVTMILAVILRVLVRFTTSLVPGTDDAVILLALVIALGEVIAISLSVNRGLGMEATLLSPTQVLGIQKGVYAAGLLYVLTIALGKASTLLLLHRLTVLPPHRLAVRVTAAAITAWTLAALLGVAFQCHLPDPWATGGDRCFDTKTFWNVIGAVDIVLDLVLIAFPLWVVWTLQMPSRRKAVVLTGFGFRIVLCAAQITRLVFLNRTLGGIDPFFSDLGYILAMQLHTTLAVVVACIPAYKIFMDRAGSGLMGVSFQGREGTYQLSSINKSNKSGENSKQVSHERGAHSDRRRNGYHAEISSNDVCLDHLDHAAHRTVEWEVRHSDEAKLNPGGGRLPSEDGVAEHDTVQTHSSISLGGAS